MFKQKRSGKIKEVIDADFRITDDIKEGKRGFFTYVTNYLLQSLNKERNKMPFTEGMSTISAVIKKLPKTPRSVIPSREAWLSFTIELNILHVPFACRQLKMHSRWQMYGSIYKIETTLRG